MGTSAIVQEQMRGAVPAGRNFPPTSPFLGVLPRELWNTRKRFWMQPFSAITNLAAAGAATASFQVDPRYYYVAFYGTATIRANAAGKALQTGFPATVTLQDSNNTNYSPTNIASDFNNVFGTAAQPSVWAIPLILGPGITLTATVTNNHNATAVDVALQLMGFLCEYSGPVGTI